MYPRDISLLSHKDIFQSFKEACSARFKPFQSNKLYLLEADNLQIENISRYFLDTFNLDEKSI